MVVNVVRLVPQSKSEFKKESENRKLNGSYGSPTANEDLNST